MIKPNKLNLIASIIIGLGVIECVAGILIKNADRFRLILYFWCAIVFPYSIFFLGPRSEKTLMFIKNVRPMKVDIHANEIADIVLLFTTLFLLLSVALLFRVEDFYSKSNREVILIVFLGNVLLDLVGWYLKRSQGNKSAAA